MIPSMVSAIVLNWNGKGVIFECLDSLLAQTYGLYEVIVVDNGSEDGSLALIKDRYRSRIKVIENPVNLGFAEGCNVGIRASSGEFIALANSDTRLDKNWMTEMVKGLGRFDSVGMGACKIYLAGLDGVFENTGQILSRDGLGRTRGRMEKDTGQYDKRCPVLCPSGCAAMYRRKMLDEIGLFDKKFFAYGDDIDTGLRGRLLGYKCFYIPTAVAYHQLSASFGLLSPFKAYLIERNRLWVVIKCFPLAHLLRSPFHTLARYFYHLYGVLRHKGPAARYVEKLSIFNLVWIMIKAYMSTVWHLPYLAGQRLKIRKKRRIKKREFELWLKRYGIGSKEAALLEISY